MKRLFLATSMVALSLAACSPATQSPDIANRAEPAPNATEPTAVTQNTAPEPGPAPSASPTGDASRTIGLEGLGDLRIGQAVPKGGRWGERGAQESDACRTVSSPDYPGVYAIVTEGKVRRITVGQRSDVKLVEGIGVGASEADVKKWFAGFAAEPHKYEEAPAKYLTAPNAESGDPALRFEIGKSGKVSMIHIGTMPVLGYVEGCS